MKRQINPENMIGKQVDILAGPYRGEWGIVKGWDGEFYHVAPWNDSGTYLIFESDEIRFSPSRR